MNAQPVTDLPGVGGARARSFAAMGIRSVTDLLLHFPRDYDDRSQVKTVAMLVPDAVNTIRGTVGTAENVTFPSRKGGKPLTVTKVKLRDETGELEICWFNQPYLKKYFQPNKVYIFTGKVKLNFNRIQMESPEYAPDDEKALSGGRIVPVYSINKSISQKLFRSLIYEALKLTAGVLMEDELPFSVRQSYNLCGLSTAVHQIHFPDSDADFFEARRRLVFEELFFMQSALFRVKGTVQKEPGKVMTDTDAGAFLDLLPYKLTWAQSHTLSEIVKDFTGGHRMNRLIQGDVGSGKTAVAIAASYVAVANGFQAAIMAPTEVLASQHFIEFDKYFSRLGFKTVLLTGSVTAKERREALTDIQDGGAQMIVGTHALIQQNVEYANLALIITDEQHRFGVNQRLSLFKKGVAPHTLVMTATPIPRTLGLILYGDMDVSVIGELPPGRLPVKTYCVNGSYRERVRGFIKREVGQGRQAYVICPAIEEPEPSDNGISKADLKNVLRYTEELMHALPGIKFSALHGRMKPTEKNEIMAAFKSGELNVIVSTTVIEVGVHVDNATLMIIENAERFGLSQLHQLRGRVGRGKFESYCVLITDLKNEQTQMRMKAMTSTSDGFKLSELDLKQRGAGDFFGTRQHGLPAFSIANLYRDMDVLQEAQAAAQDVFRREVPLTETERGRFDLRVERVLRAAGSMGVL